MTTLIVANIPLLPYNAEDGPRITSMRWTNSKSRPKSWPKKLFDAKIFSVIAWPLTMTRNRVL